ncbi:MAG: hypothetical protein CMD33_00055 [Flavobacteriales bacterium]|jgi:hypothetical protein|nr:hypothetical protein [Flavobacteriales bacterium]
MRKRLCYLYNILASYPVIVLLLAGLVGLFYVARQHYPLEMQRQAKNLQRMELKQELQALQQKLTSIEQNDLRMRYMLFNEEFLKTADAESEALKSLFTQAFEVHGWILQTAEVAELEIPTEQDVTSNSNQARIQGIMLDLSASATNSPQVDEAPFLPLYSLTQCLNYLWSRPPFKEYQQIEIVRTQDGYELQARLFLPLKDSDLGDSNELSLNRP